MFKSRLNIFFGQGCLIILWLCCSAFVIMFFIGLAVEQISTSLASQDAVAVFLVFFLLGLQLYSTWLAYSVMVEQRGSRGVVLAHGGGGGGVAQFQVRVPPSRTVFRSLLDRF